MPFLALELRDNPTDPHSGSYHFASFEMGSSHLGGSVNFVKFVLENSVYIGWPGSTVLALSGRLGLATPYGDTQDLVIEDRFKAGGSTTIRGYRDERVGPVDAVQQSRGRRSADPVQRRVAVPHLALSRRRDVLRRRDGHAPGARFRVSTSSSRGPAPGFGITTPIGPLRFDVGYALRQLRDEDRLQFYVTVGNAF